MHIAVRKEHPSSSVKTQTAKNKRVAQLGDLPHWVNHLRGMLRLPINRGVRQSTPSQTSGWELRGRDGRGRFWADRSAKTLREPEFAEDFPNAIAMGYGEIVQGGA